MVKKKDNDNWTQVNDVTNYITSKVKPSRIKKIFLTTFISLIMVITLAISIFFIALAMESAFNINTFKEEIPEESIIIDMNQVPITASDKNLRLPYFEEESKKQVFDLLIKESWWNNFFSTDINDYEFTYYQSNSNQVLDKSLIQTDGLTKFDLKLKFKSSFIEFKIPVIAVIQNTNKFYEKFMRFNQFEGKFDEHISGRIPPSGDKYLPEQWFHGYLPNNFYYPEVIDNTIVYQTIEKAIEKFTNDYQEEFANTTRLFPIISTIALPDINLNVVRTIEPYFKLIKDPKRYYVGKAPVGDERQYLNLYSYSTKSDPFYITYVSNPNIVYDLIKKAPTSIDDVIDYLKVNPIDFVPFSMVQTAKDNTDTLIDYSPQHKLLATDTSGKHFQYQELGHYFGLTNSINNNVETIDSSDYPNIGALEKFLQNKYWQAMYDFAVKNFNFFSLRYPDPTTDPNDNWKNVTNSLVTFQDYFKKALNVKAEDLTSFTFLDINHQSLPLNTSDIINANDIKKIRFHVGKNKITSNFSPKPHSFNFTFKINWW